MKAAWVRPSAGGTLLPPGAMRLPPCHPHRGARARAHCVARQRGRASGGGCAGGVFLSGGIDSGALAGLMVEAGARNLQGITIAYDEFAGTHDDEAPVAATLAAHYGISHHVRRVTREEFAGRLPRILAAMDQPSVDGINTWYATKAVAELGLKVVVSAWGVTSCFRVTAVLANCPVWCRRGGRQRGCPAPCR